MDPSLAEDQAVVTIMLRDGRRLTKRVEHAIGSLDHPMTDRDLEHKLHGLCDEVLGSRRSDELIAACWNLDASPNAGDLAKRAVVV